MKNKLDDLRNHLFKQLDRLSVDGLSTEQMDSEVNRTYMIVEVAKTIVDTARIEIDFYKVKTVSAEIATTFFDEPEKSIEIEDTKTEGKEKIVRPPARYTNKQPEE